MILYIDKAGLEDLITFHEAEFEITDGYHFSSGRNNEVNNVIKILYDFRLTVKHDTNPAPVVLKLLMNPMYGNTVIKPVETDTVIEDSRNDFEKCCSLNGNYIDSVFETHGRYYINKSNQLCISLIVVLKLYQCLNELCIRCSVYLAIAVSIFIVKIQIQYI